MKYNHPLLGEVVFNQIGKRYKYNTEIILALQPDNGRRGSYFIGFPKIFKTSKILTYDVLKNSGGF
jgi:hypothetical protein